MTSESFAAQIADWVNRVEGAAEAVFKESAQEVASRAQTTRDAGGRMRVDTGFLRASLLASTAAMPSIRPEARPVEGSNYSYNGSDITAVIAGAELGGPPIYMGYTASYAAFREFGANGQAPDAFVRTAAQQWPAIVAEKEAELKSRLGL